MEDDLVITGTTVGDISYVVAYYDVNTGNLYDANGNMYGNSTLTTTLDNEFILELHYVQDISTDSDPTTWAVWNGLEGKTVDSSLAFDSDYKHAYEGASTESTAAASHEIKITVSSVDKDTLNSEGNLIINPYGLEPEQIPQGSTSTPRMVVPYDSFEYVSSNTSGTVFKFHVADPDGLMYAVPANIQVRVSDPLYLYINPSSIYEVNIPPRYNEGVFKFPMNIMSRKLLKALDYTGVSGVVGTLEHKISVRRDTLTGVSYNSNTYTRDKDKDSTAVYSGDTFLFCAWVNGSSTIWTKGNDVQTNTAVYSISNGTASLLGNTANPVTETDSVLFRTFAFPFLVKNLIDYNATIDIPMQDVDWAKDYIISIIKNNMEEVTGKASTGAYGVVKIANDGTIDVNDGVVSIATSLATKQDNMSATAPVAINNSTVSLNIGDGLDVGVTGTTNANKLIVNEASVKEVLEDVVDGGTEPAVNEIVTADNLKGALSVGQAVDVSCTPILNDFTQISTDGSTWTNFTADVLQQAIFSNTAFHIKLTTTSTAAYNWGFNWNQFPKRAPGLKYLLLVDVCNEGDAVKALTLTGTASSVSGVKYNLTGTQLNGGNTDFVRLACTFSGDDNNRAYLQGSSNNAGVNVQIKMLNWRQYEVTTLTDEAIAYIAQLPDPDAFFRSTSAYSIRDKYLIKQDMVCPFIPTINMPDNSDLTVAAGLSYKIKYTNDNTHTITADTIPTDAYGWDTHIQMFIKGTSAINFQAPLVLMDALTPNAGHNMVVKWRNGDALVYVDDTNAGYIVISTSGTTAGTLNYYLQQDPGTGRENYIIFGAITDGETCDADSVAVNYNTNIVGNGTDKTTITGTYSVASGNTMNLQDLAVSGSTFNGAGFTNFSNLELVDVKIVKTSASDSASKYTLSNVTIPSGSTVFTSSINNYRTFYDLSNVKVDGVLNLVDQNIYPTSIIGNGIIDFNEYGNGFIIFSTTGTKTLNGIMIKNAGRGGGGAISIISGDVSITNCTIVGCTSGWNGSVCAASQGATVNFTDCIFLPGYSAHENHGFIMSTLETVVTVKDCIFADASDGFYNNGAQLVFKGTHICGDRFFIRCGSNTKFEDNTVLDLTGKTVVIPQTGESYTIEPYTHSGSFYLTNGSPTIGNNFIIKKADGVDIRIDACKIKNHTLSFDGILEFTNGPDRALIAEPSDVWNLNNLTIKVGGAGLQVIDLSAVNTAVFRGCTFNGYSYIYKSPMRIQLPASTTVSFQGNTNDANTKILEAGLIIVGDNPASPSGSATVVNASGASSTVSGIGTYIDKEGDNDFVANNTTNVVPVDGSTTGAKYLGTVLSATTGDTGANRFAKIDSGAVAVVNEATNAVNKQIITHDYEPILGGTFSLTSATVNEATKTMTILEGGTMSIVDVRGGKDSVIDLNQKMRFYVSRSVATFEGVMITGGTNSGNGGGLEVYSGTANLSNCTLTGNIGNYGGGFHGLGCTINMHSVIVSGNTGATGAHINGAFLQRTAYNVTDCQFGEGEKILLRGGDAVNITTFNGSNHLLNVIQNDSGGGKIVLTSGAILDLTGNTNPTPIAPGGDITFEQGGATVLYSSGAVSGSYMMDNVTLPAGAKLTNTAVVDVGGPNHASCKGSMSGVTLTSGRINFRSGATVASDTTLNNGGQLVVWHNTGSAVNTTVNSSGYFYISSGGVASSVTNNTGGNTYVYFGGVATDVTINGGWVYALASGGLGGGTINNAIVNFQGRLRVDSGGVLNEPVISSGGTMIVQSGGSALLVTSNTGAIVTVAEDGYITYK